jgi:type II secretory pathway pseudopilin PulG
VRPARPTSSPRNRALTLIEVVLAVLLLSLTISVVMGAISSMAGNDAFERRRLAASEIANRIMLQYLDDEKGLPPKTEAIEYGAFRFLWRLDKTTATMVINRKQEAAGANLQKLDRYLLVCVTVFDAQQEGNFEVKGEPLAYLTRVIDPYAPRNPDSIETYSTDMSKIQEMIQGIVGSAGSDSSAAQLQGKQLR